MRFYWHCRDCNNQGTANVTLEEIRKLDEKEINIFKMLITFVKRTIHKDCRGDIGIRSLSI